MTQPTDGTAKYAIGDILWNGATQNTGILKTSLTTLPTVASPALAMAPAVVAGGQIAARNSLSTTEYTTYCRRDGCTFTGIVNLGDNNITNIKNADMKALSVFNPDFPLGREMMASEFLRHFGRLRGSQGRSPGDEQAVKRAKKAPPALPSAGLTQALRAA